MQDSVDVPDPVILVGVSVQDRPVAGPIIEARLTTPLKPWTAVIVTVEGPAAPAFIVMVVGLAAIVKSWTVYVIVVG